MVVAHEDYEDEDDVADGEDTVRDAAGGRGVRAVGGTGSKVPEGKVRGKGLLNHVDSKPSRASVDAAVE